MFYSFLAFCMTIKKLPRPLNNCFELYFKFIKIMYAKNTFYILFCNSINSGVLKNSSHRSNDKTCCWVKRILFLFPFFIKLFYDMILDFYIKINISLNTFSSFI